jgi:hypothetical protein
VRVGGSVAANRNAVIELAKLRLVAMQPGPAGTPSTFTLLRIRVRRGPRGLSSPSGHSERLTVAASCEPDSRRKAVNDWPEDVHLSLTYNIASLSKAV